MSIEDLSVVQLFRIAESLGISSGDLFDALFGSVEERRG